MNRRTRGCKRASDVPLGGGDLRALDGGARSRSEPVAIIGASCRFPDAPDLARFWDLLLRGGDAIGEVPDDRWTKDFFFHPRVPTPGKSYSWAAGTIGDVGGFDAAFFGVSPREADQIDPQQRLLLELSWEAFEDAGLAPSRLAGTATGVYIGASSLDYVFGTTGDPAVANAYFMTGTSLSILANRISHLFDLRGPSLVVDTACSSSLVALDLACRALAAGEVELALVGGVNLLLSPYPYVGFPRRRCCRGKGAVSPSTRAPTATFVPRAAACWR
jgi:acyl transferase domain-containing protein